MVGVIIIGIIGSIVAATIFAVIPWAQDNAAKHQLSSITIAQNGYAGLSDSHGYTDSATLNDASLLQAGASYCTVASADGKSYTGYSRSATGKVFTNSSSNTIPHLTTDAGCLPASGANGNNGSGTTDPALAKTSSFTINCPAGSTQAQLPIVGATGVETWNDGVTNTYSNEKAAVRTVTAGVNYTVTFVGTFKTLISSNIAGVECLRSMDSWGSDTGTTDATRGFDHATNLVSVPTTLPATVTSTSYMFQYTTVFNQSLNGWDMSHVTSTRGMFFKATGFNADLSKWKLDSLKDAGQMFQQATAFNQNISSWNMGSVTRLDGMFYGDPNFNQPLNTWDVRNVADMGLMFQGATSFNQPLNNWTTDNLVTMKNMFMGASAFNQSVNNFNVSQVSDFSNVFSSATSFNQPLNNWTPVKATSMANTFQQAKAFNQDISGWDVSSVTTYSNFRVGSALTDANTPAKLRV
jgi:surface protein